jgi:hypothetical protein
MGNFCSSPSQDDKADLKNINQNKPKQVSSASSNPAAAQVHAYFGDAEPQDPSSKR